MNNYTCSGRIVRDCEVRKAGNSTICTFAVAVKAGYGDRESTLWVRANLWGKRAESALVDYLKKGQEVVVSGELSMSTWTNKDDVEKQTLDLNVTNVDLVGGKKDDGEPLP